jgi:hypothetical protein
MNMEKETIGRTHPEATGPGLEEQTRKTAQSLKAEAVDRGRRYLEQGKGTTADFIRDFAEAVETAASHLESRDRGTVGSYIRSASREMQRWSSVLRDYEVDRLADQVQTFAGRHPALLLGGAAVAGFAFTRVFRTVEGSREPMTQEPASAPDTVPAEEAAFSPAGAAARSPAEEYGPHS